MFFALNSQNMTKRGIQSCECRYDKYVTNKLDMLHSTKKMLNEVNEWNADNNRLE